MQDMESNEPLQTDLSLPEGGLRAHGDMPRLACQEGCYAVAATRQDRTGWLKHLRAGSGGLLLTTVYQQQGLLISRQLKQHHLPRGVTEDLLGTGSIAIWGPYRRNRLFNYVMGTAVRVCSRSFPQSTLRGSTAFREMSSSRCCNSIQASALPTAGA